MKNTISINNPKNLLKLHLTKKNASQKILVHVPRINSQQFKFNLKQEYHTPLTDNETKEFMNGVKMLLKETQESRTMLVKVLKQIIRTK